MKSRHTAAFQIWKITYFIIAQRCPFFNRQLCSLCKENWLNIFGAERSPYFLSASTYFTICRSSTRSKPFTTPSPFRSATERVAGSEILYASPNMYWFNCHTSVLFTSPSSFRSPGTLFPMRRTLPQHPDGSGPAPCECG